MLNREFGFGTIVPIPVKVGLKEIDINIGEVIVITEIFGHHHTFTIILSEVVASWVRSLRSDIMALLAHS